jgi:hypothetical protein
MKALKPQRRRDKLTDQWIDLPPIEKLRCDLCGAWEGPKTPVRPLDGQLPGKPVDCCPSCYARLSKLKPIPRA